MHSTFKQLRLGVVFQVNKYDLTQWVKTSTKTARLLENNKAYYFQQKEPVFALHFLNTQDTIRG
jgi:hypothetical protein